MINLKESGLPNYRYRQNNMDIPSIDFNILICKVSQPPPSMITGSQSGFTLLCFCEESKFRCKTV